MPLAIVAVAAWLNAQAVSALVGVAIDADAQELSRAPARAPQGGPPPPPEHARSAHAILARNPFDSVTGPLVAPSSSPSAEENGDASPGVDTSDPWSAPTCDGLEVNAIAASDDADWSIASVSGADSKSRLLRRGASIAGKMVHFIGWDRLWLSSESGLCQAKLFDPKKAPPPPAAPPPAQVASPQGPVPPGPKPLDPELRKGIQAVSATEFNIERGVVDRIIENQAELMRSARVMPVQEGGRVVGVRLIGMRPDSLLGVLGMQSGDQLQTINGFDIGNPEKALEAYARLRTADKLTIQLSRGGKRMNLDYNIK